MEKNNLFEINVEKQEIADCFQLPRKHARYVIESSVDLQNPEVVEKSQQIHGVCYNNYGYVKEEALEDDGKLVSELDGTRTRDDGKIVVNYLLARSPNKPIEEAGASVRLIDIGENGDISDLPTFKYFKESFSPEVIEKIDAIIDLYGKKSIREIGALSVVKFTDTIASFELMRAIMQNSVMRDKKHGLREYYIASLTETSLAPILKFAGPKSIEILGDPVRVYAEDPRQEEVYVTPVLINPNNALEEFAKDLETAKKESDIFDLVQKLVFLTDGLSREQIGERASALLDKIPKRQIS